MKTCFAWNGGSDPSGVYYYRIHSPIILIEFDHQHIGCVVRTRKGNDSGQDLLRPYYHSWRTRESGRRDALSSMFVYAL